MNNRMKRNAEYFAKRCNTTVSRMVPGIAAHRTTVALATPAGLRAVHMGGASAVPRTVKQDRARIPAVPAPVRATWYMSGTRTVAGRQLDFAQGLTLFALGITRTNGGIDD